MKVVLKNKWPWCFKQGWPKFKGEGGTNYAIFTKFVLQALNAKVT